jgi:xylulokinase
MDPGPVVLAVDLGTQSLRLSAVTRDGGRPWSWSRPVETRTDGAVSEQDPAIWDALLRDGLADAAASGVRPVAIAAAGPLAGWTPHDREGRPVGPAAMYFDGRSAPDLERLEATEGQRTDGLRPTIADPVPHLLRLRRERPDLFARTARLLDATGVLVHRLSGAATVDAYTALRLPGPAVAGRLAVDVGLFGRPVSVGETVGDLAADLARPFGGGRIPVVAATFDSKCAYVASGILQPGEALDISGTVTSFGVAHGRRVVDPQRRFYSVPLDGGWLVRGSMGGTGSILEWSRAQLIDGGDLGALEAMAATVPPGARGVTFLPFHSGARAPLWSPGARGAFLGLSLDTGRAEMARAVFEGLAYGLRHVVDVMAAGGVGMTDVRLAGGLARSDLLTRLKADVLGRPALRLADHELTTLGLAVIAFTAVGVFPDRAAASRALVHVADAVAPDAPSRTAHEEPYRRYVAAVEALAPTFAPPAIADGRRKPA